MTDRDLKELYLNNLHDLKNISNFLNLTEEQRNLITIFKRYKKLLLAV